MDITLAPYFIGLASSALTELLKLIPALNSSTIVRALTAIVVMIAVTLFSMGFNLVAFDWAVFGQVVIWALVNYKMIVQPVAITVSSPTQEPQQ